MRENSGFALLDACACVRYLGDTMKTATLRVTHVSPALLDRKRSVYSLCLACQNVARDVREGPWFSLWHRLANAELTALQSGNVPEADRLFARRLSHESLLTSTAS